MPEDHNHVGYGDARKRNQETDKLNLSTGMSVAERPRDLQYYRGDYVVCFITEQRTSF